jgi:hypothetical protein
MESHHFGWWPSFISEAAKWSYWTPSPSVDEVLRRIAKRDFGEENIETVISAWKFWSEGMRHYISTNADQYGPFRIGPSYPFVFGKNVQIPTVPYAMHGGNLICETVYNPVQPYETRLSVETEYLVKMKDYFIKGVNLLEGIYEKLSENKKKNASKMINLGKFMINSIITAINIKNWYILKQKLLSEKDKNKIDEYINKMIFLGKEKIKNAENTLPLVEEDSRLGWEPSMEYMTDKYHLQWKIKQVMYVLDNELPMYKAALKNNF